MLESFSSGGRCVKRLRSEPPKRRFWVRPAQRSAWWDNVQAALTIVLDIASTRSNQGLISALEHWSLNDNTCHILFFVDRITHFLYVF